MAAELDGKFLGINLERSLFFFLFSELEMDFIVPYPRERKKVSILKIEDYLHLTVFI